MSLHIQDYFKDQYSSTTPGMGLIAIKNEEIVFQNTIGLANCEHEIPITLDTVFNLASLSKQFTGMAILQLIERKQINLNDKITKYISELSHYSDNITIYNLVHHSSGLIDYNDLLWQKARNNALYSTNTEIIQLLKNETQTLFTPGTKYEYSNSNYVLLALIIERVSGLSFKEYLCKYIFEPVGMKSSLVFSEEQPIVPNRAYGYEKEDNEWKCAYVDTFATGAANVFSSLNDLYLWDKALYSDLLLNEQLRKKLFEPGVDSQSKILMDTWGNYYSYGWMLRERCGEKTIWHTGSDAGFRSVIVRFYEKNFSVIILCNSTDFDWQSSYDITEKLFMEFNR